MKYVIIGILFIISLPLIFSALSFIFPFIIIGLILTCIFSKSQQVSLDNNVLEKNKSTNKIDSLKVSNNLTKETITTKVAGVTFNNRQSYIQKLQIGDSLILRREHDNKYDENAIAIYDIKENHIGYIPKDLAVKLVDLLDSAFRYDCTINKITGGGHLNYGLIINICFRQNQYSNKYTVKVKREKTDKGVLELACKSNTFYEFVNSISEPLLKTFIKIQYENIKRSNDFEHAHLGTNGSIEFVGALLLYTYSSVKKENITANNCVKSIQLAFIGAAPLMFSDAMDIVINEKSNIKYSEWSSVYRYLDFNHGKWIREFEFAKDYTVEDHLRFKSFINKYE